MNSQALPYIILLGLVWGSNLVAARFGLGQFDPLLFVGLRLALASLAHTAVYLVDRRRHLPLDRQLWRRAIWLGVLGTAVPMTSLLASLQYQSSGITSIYITTAPAITVIMAHFFLADEFLTRRKSLGIMLALGGALLLVLRGESGLPDVAQASPLGFALVMLGIICGSAMGIYARKYMRDFDAFDVASIRMFVATAAVLPLAFFTGFDLSRVDGQGYLTLVYASLVGAFVGLLLEFYIIKRFGATAAVMTAYVIPIVATLGGAFFLDETITAMMIVGIVLISLGIAIINQRHQPPVFEGVLPPR